MLIKCKKLKKTGLKQEKTSECKKNIIIEC